jgi:hypothetical protein
MCNELKLAQGYAKVCVLLIRWAECDWPENTEKEVSVPPRKRLEGVTPRSIEEKSNIIM